jgi:DNA-binding response OmpR family regulator
MFSIGQRAASLPAMVLFVDPDTASAQRLADAIRDQFTGTVVGSASEAWAAMRRQIPMVVVTELDLPDSRGLDLIAGIYNTAATHNVLVMVITARTSVSDKIAALQAGADDYMIKPVESTKFRTHLQLVSRFRVNFGERWWGGAER